MGTLISCDEENPAKFSISKQAASMCTLVKTIIEGDKTATEVEIKKVKGPILKKVVEDPWDAEWINKQSKEVTFQIILGANYMDIKSLLHLGCAKIATLIKGKSPEEIKK